MDAPTDGLLVAHGHCYNLCLFSMDASTEGLVVVHRHCYNICCCYVICTRLVVEAAV